MKPTTTSGFIAIGMEHPALEIEAFEQLVEQYRTRVLRFIYASVRDMDVAVSLTQDCFWNAYRSRNGFRGDCSVQTWLMKIAVNLVRDHSRKRRLQFWKRASVASDDVHDWPDGCASPEDRAAANEQIHAVWKASKELSDKQRTVFLLRFVEDMDIADISESTGLTENAVNVHLFRAVRGIRKRLGKSK